MDDKEPAEPINATTINNNNNNIEKNDEEKNETDHTQQMDQLLDGNESTAGSVHSNSQVETHVNMDPFTNIFSSSQEIPGIKFRDVVLAKKFGNNPFDRDR